MWSIYSLEHDQISSGQPPKRGWVILRLHSCQKPSAKESQAVASVVLTTWSHQHQHGPWLYQDHWFTRYPQGCWDQESVSSWSQVVRQATHTSMAPEAAKSEDITKTAPGSQASSRSGPAEWTNDTNISSGGIADHSGPSWKSNPEGEMFLISGLCHCPGPVGSCSPAACWGTESASA